MPTERQIARLHTRNVLLATVIGLAVVILVGVLTYGRWANLRPRPSPITTSQPQR